GTLERIAVEAEVDLVALRQLTDDLLDANAPIGGRHAEAGQIGQRPHQTRVRRLALFRLEERVSGNRVGQRADGLVGRVARTAGAAGERIGDRAVVDASA